MLPLLAALPSPDSPQALGWIVLTIAGLALAVNQVLSFTDRFREQPPASVTYTTKAEHRELAKKMDEELGREQDRGRVAGEGAEARLG